MQSSVDVVVTAWLNVTAGQMKTESACHPNSKLLVVPGDHGVKSCVSRDGWNQAKSIQLAVEKVEIVVDSRTHYEPKCSIFRSVRSGQTRAQPRVSKVAETVKSQSRIMSYRTAFSLGLAHSYVAGERRSERRQGRKEKGV